jgi:hypothetical protein
MNPSYVRLRVPVDDARSRFAQWVGFPELAPPKKVKAVNAVRSATKNGQWRSRVAVFVCGSDSWTVFHDLTGFLASIPAKRWAELAGHDELVFAGYNDAVPYGQLIVVRGGRVVREFLNDQQDPQQNVNRGKLAFEKREPITDWITAASFVDGDDVATMSDTGFLWMFGKVS